MFLSLCSQYLDSVSKMQIYMIIHDNTHAADTRVNKLFILNQVHQSTGWLPLRMLTQKLKGLSRSNHMQIGWAPMWLLIQNKSGRLTHPHFSPNKLPQSGKQSLLFSVIPSVPGVANSIHRDQHPQVSSISLLLSITGTPPHLILSGRNHPLD